jgi:hypothetical protein
MKQPITQAPPAAAGDMVESIKAPETIPRESDRRDGMSGIGSVSDDLRSSGAKRLCRAARGVRIASGDHHSARSGGQEGSSG